MTDIKMKIISLENVSLFREQNKILDNVSLDIYKGEHWALIGHNGCGKTTLLNVITGYLWPTDGKVTILGEEYGQTDIRRIRKRIGMVSSALFERIPYNDTFLDVVLSGMFGSLGVYDEISDEDKKKALVIADFLGHADIVKRPYRVLSFGERQSALLGRALMAEPEILILDEPCEGLDIPSREKILLYIDILTGKPEAPAIIFVTHRVEEISSGITHAALMKSGRIIEQGFKEEKLTSETFKKAMGIDLELVRNNGRIYAHIK
jgi:iron complex transport system ATP-binding protein